MNMKRKLSQLNMGFHGWDLRLPPAKTSEYCQGKITFAEFDATVQGWINHVRYADTWRLREYILWHKGLKRQNF